MAEDIRPAYYKAAAIKYRHILIALGFNASDFELECEEFWEKYALDFSAPGSSAVKYLWRCGGKDPEAQDLAKARYFLKRFIQQIRKTWNTRILGQLITEIWPTIEQIENAIALVDKALEELDG